MTDWVWSDWITPGLVAAKANIGQANAGASVALPDSSDPDAAVDAVVRGGRATFGSSLDGDANLHAPYSYMSSGEVNADPFSFGFTAVGYDRSGVVLTSPPQSFANFNVGYTCGYWRQRPTLRQVPPEFWDLVPGVDWVPIDAVGTNDWDGKVEFEPGVATAAVKWADVWLTVTSPGGTILGGTVGYAPSILLPSTDSAWSGSFGAWPPPLGAAVLDLAPGGVGGDLLLPATPPAGGDFTVVSYTDLAVTAYSPNEDWQRWEVRPHGGPLGQALYIWYQMPRYRYRIPATGKPRFFVKHRDESMRPVGFGRPSSEPTTFRVPGGGRWRDLTTAEYATHGPTSRPPGGMSLKVKRSDASGGTWWDQVGWMVPDA